MKRFGFTLAEVLITLGIIGVVAAMTLPSLVSNYQKQAYVAGIKKAYSMLSNMMSKIAADEGVGVYTDSSFFSDLICTPDIDGRNPNGCEDSYGNPSKFEEVVPKYFNVVKICKGTDCDVNYITYSTVQDGKLVFSNSRTSISSAGAVFQKPVIGFYTSDGMIYYFTVGYESIIVFIDVNGERNPNTSGRDLFNLVLCKNGNITFGNPQVYCDKNNPNAVPGYEDMSPFLYLMRHGWKMDY